ncbi:hypothetical protein Tco_0434462 [Tanacetum coccineum]
MSQKVARQRLDDSLLAHIGTKRGGLQPFNCKILHFTLQAPGSANAACLSILIPNDVKALPSRAEQRHSGCD